MRATPSCISTRWAASTISCSAQDITGESSYYVSNIHSANLGARFTFLKRADLYLGYSHVQDVGDGRATPVGAGIYSTPARFQAAQTFPLRYLSPQVRLSIRITPKLRWNAGYQYYGYREQFSAAQDYRAHTGFSSLAFSFLTLQNRPESAD